jgi:hypothetical protein
MAPNQLIPIKSPELGGGFGPWALLVNQYGEEQVPSFLPGNALSHAGKAQDGACMHSWWDSHSENPGLETPWDVHEFSSSKLRFPGCQ